MRALLAAVGTRGDVQPALALALELRKLGHAVRLCISPNFVDWAKSLGLEAVPMGVEMRMPAQRSGAMPKLTPEELRRLRESMPDLITDQFETIGAAADGCDVIVGANAHQYAAPSIAEHAGIGCVTAVYAPVALPSPDLAPPPTPGQTADATRRREHRGAVAQHRQGLERARALSASTATAAGSAWPRSMTCSTTSLRTTPGSPPMPHSPRCPPLLAGRSSKRARGCSPMPRRFLRSSMHSSKRGEPPIFVGFGSMPAAGDVAVS